MRLKTWIVAFAVLLAVVACVSAAEEKSAVVLPSNDIGNVWGGGGFSAGWEFTPAQDIVVTQLGLALAQNDTYVHNEHIIRIYDSGGNVVVSTIFAANTPLVRDESDWYAYNPAEPQGCTLLAGQTYVVAFYAASVQYDPEIKYVTGEVFDDLITVGRKGLYTVGLALPTTDIGFGYEFLTASFKFEPKDVTISVQIDIKPGTFPNPINQGANGVIPVAILTTPGVFDAADVDPATVVLNGASVAVRGKSDKLLARMEDVDGDGDADLVCQVDTECWADLFEDGYVTLTGQTLGGVAIEGQDYVIVVPPEP